MTAPLRNDLPPPGAPNFNERVRETLQIYLGVRGPELNRGLVVGDLVDAGLISIVRSDRPGGLTPGKQPPIRIEPGVGVLTPPPDLTPPPVPGGFKAKGLISAILVETDPPTYRQGGGHLRTRIYGAKVQVGNPLPVFSDAVEIAQFLGNIGDISSDPSTTWRLWAKWETAANVLSPTPAGGINGLEAITGADIQGLLDALIGKINAVQLNTALGARINLIDAPAGVAGSVATQVALEATNRAAALTTETQRRVNALLAEAAARQTALNAEHTERTAVDAALQSQINLLSAASTGDLHVFIAAIRNEQEARIAGDTAEARQRTVLAATVQDLSINVDYNAELANLTRLAGMVLYYAARIAATAQVEREQFARTAADTAMAGDVLTLTARVGTTEAAAVLESTVQATANAALSRQITSLQAALNTSSAGLTAQLAAQANVDTAIAQSVTALTATVGANNTAQSVAVQNEATVRASQTGDLFAQYTIKVDLNGYVAGYGIAATAINGTPSSTFAVRADSFYIASPSGPGIAPAFPFIVQTSAGPWGVAGVYMRDAFIANASITAARIADLAVDNAKIANLSASKLTAGAIAVGEHIQSAGYVADSLGWRIDGNGTARFNEVIVRGTVSGGQSAYNQGVGFWLGSDGRMSVGSPTGQRLTWSGSSLNINGEINVGGFTGFSWPLLSSAGGAHLSANALMLGNLASGKYFYVGGNGDVYTPGMQVVNGLAQFYGTVTATAFTTLGGRFTAKSDGTVVADLVDMRRRLVLDHGLYSPTFIMYNSHRQQTDALGIPWITYDYNAGDEFDYNLGGFIATSIYDASTYDSSANQPYYVQAYVEGGPFLDYSGVGDSSFSIFVTGAVAAAREYRNDGSNLGNNQRLYVKLKCHIILNSGSFVQFRLPDIRWIVYKL